VAAGHRTSLASLIDVLGAPCEKNPVVPREEQPGEGEPRAGERAENRSAGPPGPSTPPAIAFEERLLESERRFRGLLENLQLAALLLDASGRVTFCNPYLARLLGHASPDEVLGRDWFGSYLLPEQAPSIRKTFAEGMRSGSLPSHYDNEIRTRNGERRLVRWNNTMLLDGAGKPEGTASVGEDVTLLRALEERLLTAQRIAGIGYWSLDLPTGRLTWSEETHRIFGTTPESFVATQEAFLALVHPGDRPTLLRSFERILEGGEPVSMDLRAVRPDGAERVVHSEARAVLDGRGRPVGLEGAVQDVTERVRLEEQLRQSQKLEAVGSLAGGVAHDFNNLLTVILSAGQMLAGTLPEGSPERVDAQEIVKAAQRGAALTRQLLAFGRRQRVEPRPVELGQVIAGVEPMIRRLIGEDVSVTLRLAETSPVVLADPHQLEQVLVNLAANARDAMPHGGTLTLSTGARVVGRNEAEALGLPGAGDYVALTVSDTGHGMSSEVQQRAFEPFFTTKPLGQGTGLGLSTVHGIVAQLRGAVEVKSAPGQGATFTILLPVHAGSAVAGAEPRSAPLPEADGKVVLLVEDQPEVWRVARRSLEQAGYRVLAASSGEEALSIAAGGGDIDLLLTDVVMPGMGGLALAARLRAARPGLRVLLMSGYADGAELGDGPLAGPLLAKPFGPRALLEKVGEVLAGPG